MKLYVSRGHEDIISIGVKTVCASIKPLSETDVEIEIPENWTIKPYTKQLVMCYAPVKEVAE